MSLNKITDAENKTKTWMNVNANSITSDNYKTVSPGTSGDILISDGMGNLTLSDSGANRAFAQKLNQSLATTYDMSAPPNQYTIQYNVGLNTSNQMTNTDAQTISPQKTGLYRLNFSFTGTSNTTQSVRFRLYINDLTNTLSSCILSCVGGGPPASCSFSTIRSLNVGESCEVQVDVAGGVAGVLTNDNCVFSISAV